MAKSKAKTLPEFDSTAELVNFFDSHDLGDYWEQMPEAEFEIKIKRRKQLIALEEEVVTKVTRIAKAAILGLGQGGWARAVARVVYPRSGRVVVARSAGKQPAPQPATALSVLKLRIAVAKAKHVSSEALINTWLKEKLQQAS